MNFFRRLSKKSADALGVSTDFDQLGDALDFDFLSDILPYRLFDSELKIYENKHSFGFVIEVVPILGGGEDVQKELASLIKEIGEEGADIQTFLFADHRIDRFLKSWEDPRQKTGGIFAKLSEERKKFLHRQSSSGDVPPRIFRFFFSFSQMKPAAKDLPLFLTNIVAKKNKALVTFSRISVAKELEPTALLELLSGLVNFDLSTKTEARGEWDQNNWLSKQVCLPGSAIEVKPDHLIFQSTLSATHMKTYESVDLPERWNLTQMSELVGDFLNSSYRVPSPFYIHYGIHFPVQQKKETRFLGKMKMLAHQSKFPALLRCFPDMPREMEEHMFVKKSLAEGEKFVETRLSAALFAAPERFVKAESALLALFQKYGFKLLPNHFLHLPDFLSSLPMAWGDDAKHIAGLKKVRCMRTTITLETPHLMPCIGEWWGNSSQGMILTGRKGQISAWDPFATDGNLNTVVVGPSGSGKSVFMQEMIMGHLGQGGRVFVLDLGRSFEKLCHLLDGQYINFSDKSGLDLNPFRLVTAEAGLEMVVSIVRTMASPVDKIDKERSDLLGTLVKAAWERDGKNASIDTLIELIDQKHFSSELMIGVSESLKESLKKYGKQGAYANYFYGKSVVDFTNNFVVIETEELKNMPDLQAVVLQMFTLAISSQVFMGDRKQRCMICIDEAWDLLKSPQMEGFIESLARRLRKYNGALVVGTQSIKDFDRSLGAKAAFQNSNWLAILGKDNDSINALKKDNLIPMNAYKEAALSSLRMENGKYSEVFIYNKASGASSVSQLKLDPFSSLLYSTKADDFRMISALKEQGLSIEEAIEKLLREKS